MSDRRQPVDDPNRSGEPTFRIATVAERTGVPEPTLRAWERRYGIPAPPRSTSGYRRYGEGDVALVSEMRRLCEGGMPASEAARLLRARGAVSPPAPAAAGEARADFDPFEAASRAIVAAVERFDDQGLDRELRRLMMMGSGSIVFERTLRPTLATIGDKWHNGELSVAQEHFASQRIETLLRDLLQLSTSAGASARVLLASFADDEHELGLLGTALHFGEWGYRPVLLGARTPPSAVRGAAEALAPAFVALSVTVTPPRERARELLDEYAAAVGDAPLLVGGSGAAAIADLVTRARGVVAPRDVAALRRLVQGLSRGAKRGRGRGRAGAGR